jgi:hypothetical protein
VRGSAIVTAIDDCPEIADGEGSVVTATFKTREVHSIVKAEILGPDGSIENIEGTPIHPIWSVNRNDWVPLGELIEGESLQAANGLATVLSIAHVTCALPVYNIEVHGEHVYQAGQFGVLVHNSYIDPRNLPWGNAGARQAAIAIDNGLKAITVASRSDAAELAFRWLKPQGYTNTTGWIGSFVKKVMGTKNGTYHWDDLLDSSGKLAGHGDGNAHGVLPHLQIHDMAGNVIRVFFPQ